jgi:hypothetical protein
MQLADRVMMAATPDLRPPQAIREGDALPEVLDAGTVAGSNGDGPDVAVAAAVATARMIEETPSISVAVIVPDSLAEPVSDALSHAGIAHGRAATSGLDDQVTVVPISVAKGLEIDGVVVVEPGRIVQSELQGMRALYVALTRPTQRLTIVHSEPLPAPLAAAVADLSLPDAFAAS